MSEHVTLLLFDDRRQERRDIDINARLTSVQVTTAVNRGFDQLTVGLAPPAAMQREGVRYGTLPEPIETRPFTRAELRVGNQVVFEGRLMPCTFPATGIVARGYWESLASDDWISSTDTTSVSTGDLIKNLLAASLLSVRPGNLHEFRDPLITHTEDAFDGRTIADVLTQITAEGDTLGNTVDWYVWEDRRLWLLPRAEPELPDYYFELDPLKMTVVCDPSQMVSGLTVEYTIETNGTATVTSGNTSVTVTHGLGDTPDDNRIRFFMTNNPTNDPGTPWIDNVGATTFDINVRNDPGASGAAFTWFAELPGQRTAEATNPEFEREFGFQRRRIVNAGGMALASAEHIRDSLIQDAKRPRWSARVRLGPDDYLPGPHGQPLAKHVARAGHWGRIANVPMLTLVATRYDMTGDVLDLDFGERRATVGEQLRRLTQAEERRSRRIDPQTGGGLE